MKDANKLCWPRNWICCHVQGALARAVDTDCEFCLDTRRKLFGLFRAAEKETESKASK